MSATEIIDAICQILAYIYFAIGICDFVDNLHLQIDSANNVSRMTEECATSLLLNKVTVLVKHRPGVAYVNFCFNRSDKHSQLIIARCRKLLVPKRFINRDCFNCFFGWQ